MLPDPDLETAPRPRDILTSRLENPRLQHGSPVTDPIDRRSRQCVPGLHVISLSVIVLV
jgi:hypothetical protein